MAFHYGIKQPAWRFATPRLAPDGKGLTSRAEVCEGGIDADDVGQLVAP
jgi:hypothetical protein